MPSVAHTSPHCAGPQPYGRAHTSPRASAPDGAGVQSPATFCDGWGETQTWAYHLGVEIASASFRAGIVVPSTVDDLAGQWVSDAAALAGIAPGIVCGTLGGVLGLAFGLRLDHGVCLGHTMGKQMSQGAIESAYRLTLLSMIGAVTAVSVGIGAGAGTAAFVARSALCSTRNACPATAPAALEKT